MAHRPRIPAAGHGAPVAVTRRRYPPEAMVRVELVEHGPPAREALREAVRAEKGLDPLAPVTVVVPSAYAGLALRRALPTPDDLVNERFPALPRPAELLGPPALAT